MNKSFKLLIALVVFGCSKEDNNCCKSEQYTNQKFLAQIGKNLSPESYSLINEWISPCRDSICNDRMYPIPPITINLLLDQNNYIKESFHVAYKYQHIDHLKKYLNKSFYMKDAKLLKEFSGKGNTRTSYRIDLCSICCEKMFEKDNILSMGLLEQLESYKLSKRKPVQLDLSKIKIIDKTRRPRPYQ